MLANRIISILFLSYDWTVKTKGQREQLIPFYSQWFNHSNSVVGETQWKTIYYMCPTIGGPLYNYSLIGFKGVIKDDKNGSIIYMSARFGQPFIWIYVLAALSFPLAQLINIPGINPPVFFAEPWMNFILPPIFVWVGLILYYVFKLKDGKRFIHRSLQEFEMHYNIV